MVSRIQVAADPPVSLSLNDSVVKGSPLFDTASASSDPTWFFQSGCTSDKYNLGKSQGLRNLKDELASQNNYSKSVERNESGFGTLCV